jgi:hypothetical protein
MGQHLTLPPQQKSIPLPSLCNHHADFVAFIHSHCGPGNYTSSIHTNSNNIHELLFLGSLAPICLGIASCQNICVELTAKFIQLINLHSFCENPQTINFFHYHVDAIVWLFSGCLRICWLTPKIPNLLGDLILSVFLM